MPAFDDHLPCPPLRRWLLPSWDGRSVAWWRGAAEAGRGPGRRSRRMLEGRGIDELLAGAEPGSLDVLVVLSTLPEPAPAVAGAIWAALRPGGLLVDLATVRRRRSAEWLRPWVFSSRLRAATALRVRQWLERGGIDPEQWIAVEPVDVVVTMVRRAVSPRAGGVEPRPARSEV